eukprot:symbB.v1.2.034689.t1/scaffold4523.1/size38513/5
MEEAVVPPSSQAETEPVKLPRLSLVEVPGRAKDVGEAVAAVGGPKAVADAIANKARLRLRLCRAYQFQVWFELRTSLFTHT